MYVNTFSNNHGKNLVYGDGTSLTSPYDITDDLLYSTAAGASLVASPTIRHDSNIYGGVTWPVPSVR